MVKKTVKNIIEEIFKLRGRITEKKTEIGEYEIELKEEMKTTRNEFCIERLKEWIKRDCQLVSSYEAQIEELENSLTVK